MFEQQIAAQLANRRQAGLLRTRSQVKTLGSKVLMSDKEYTNFAGNDYLGLGSEMLELSRVYSGATASPLVTGTSSLHTRLEQELLTWLEAPEDFGCLLFSSGFAANTGVISALFNNKNADARLIQDKLNHASLMDAGKHVQAMGHCRQHRFEHNNTNKLQSILRDKCDLNAAKLVVTEGVFSMDGDSPDLPVIKQLCQQNNAWLMLDDAHGVGIHGNKGQGTFAKHGMTLSSSDILVVTFGKAIGAQGAAVLASQDTIEYLTNFSREYIYSTHLSPLQAEATFLNIQKVQKQDWRRDKLQQNIGLFHHLAAELPFSLLPSDSAIQPIVVGGEELALDIAQKLKQKGIWTGAMRYPTVAKGQARLRVTLSSMHSEQEIKQLVDELMLVGAELNA